MASPSDRADENPWDELEQGFFAAAPPDVAEPPAEPMRFDDLDPVTPDRPEGRVQAWRAAAKVSAAAAWRKLAPARAKAAIAWRKAAPAVVAAAAVSRRSTARLATLARTAARAGQAQAPRVLAIFRNSSRQTRLLAAGIAALVAVTGVSAGVVASRGGGSRSLPPGPAVASRAPVACQPPSPPVAMTAAPEEDPFPASASIATRVTAPAPRKRKQVKTPPRPAARAKTLSKAPQGPIARPTSAR